MLPLRSALVIVTLLSRSTAQPLPGLSKAMAIALVLESQILAALHRVHLPNDLWLHRTACWWRSSARRLLAMLVGRPYGRLCLTHPSNGALGITLCGLCLGPGA